MTSLVLAYNFVMLYKGIDIINYFSHAQHEKRNTAEASSRVHILLTATSTISGYAMRKAAVTLFYAMFTCPTW